MHLPQHVVDAMNIGGAEHRLGERKVKDIAKLIARPVIAGHDSFLINRMI